MIDENRKIFEEAIKTAVECEICAENPLDNDQDETLSCGHLVHSFCIRQYLVHETKTNRKLDIPCMKCQKEGAKNPFI